MIKATMPMMDKPMMNAPLGQGGRFAALKKSISAKGKVRNPGAVAAAIGRKKYGKAKFQKLAAKGRKKTIIHKGKKIYG